MASRRVRYPLDPSAVASANRRFWKSHPELDGKTLKADSDVRLRQEWVDSYLASGGALETEVDSPPDEVVASCPATPLDCTTSWQQCESQADSILNKSQDPVQRNKHINAAYAKMYLEDPRLEWLGAAAFASKQVGCGISDAKRYKDLAEIDRNPWNPDGPNPVLQMQGAYAEPVYDALSNGNKAVFKDIYPAHLFYKKHGLEGLRRCGAARQPPLDNKVLDGFQDIDSGHSDVGALKILQHEQMDILQAREVFGNQEMVKIMKTNQWASEHWYGRLFGAKSTSVSFSAACTGEPSVTFHGSNPADPNERWPYAQEVVSTFDKLKSDPKTVEQLEAIVKAGQ